MIKVKWLLIGFVISMGGMTQADTELTLASTLDSFHQAAAHADIDSYIAHNTFYSSSPIYNYFYYGLVSNYYAQNAEYYNNIIYRFCYFLFNH